MNTLFLQPWKQSVICFGFNAVSTVIKWRPEFSFSYWPNAVASTKTFFAALQVNGSSGTMTFATKENVPQQWQDLNIGTLAWKPVTGDLNLR